jgi:hypothetical protein
METPAQQITLVVTYRTDAPRKLTVSPTTSLAELQTTLEELTGVPPHLQKLLYKGQKKVAGDTSVVSLEAVGMKDGAQIKMLGSSQKEVDSMLGIEEEKRKREMIMKQREARGPTKVRSIGTGSSSSLSYRFHNIVPLGHLPNPSAATELLTRLSEDPAVRHVMQMHRFSVGTLTELAPHEHPELLGLNENRGQTIKLRIRTDRYDGFRLYSEIRRVLAHELTHNVWGDHDDNFKQLNSQLNREIAQFERDQKRGTHSFNEGEVYEPEIEAYGARSQLIGGSNVLGGSAGGHAADSREERRLRVLQATLARIQKEEKDIEDRCGNA